MDMWRTLWRPNRYPHNHRLSVKLVGNDASRFYVRYSALGIVNICRLIQRLRVRFCWSLSPWGSPYTIWTSIERRSNLNKYEKGIECCHLDYRPTSVKQLLFKIMYTMEYHNIIMLLLGPLSSPQTLCFWPFYPICFLKIGTLLWVKKQLSIKALGL